MILAQHGKALVQVITRAIRSPAYLIALSFFVSFGSAGARELPIEPLIQRLKPACIEQFRPQAKQGQQINSLVRNCIVKKIDDAWSLPAELELFEFTPWLIKNSGPAKSKGVIYFIAGWGGIASPDRFHLAPYLLKTLNEEGWDVIGAKFPESFNYYASPKSLRLSEVATTYVGKRLKTLKDTGYPRIVLLGHSWGAWVSMQTLRDPRLADAMMLLSPACCGGGDEKNFTNFGPELSRVRTPTILTLFSGDSYNVGQRGPVAEKVFAKDSTAHIIMDRPPGFSGHYAGWIPFFDFVFGKCVESFLDNPASKKCSLPPRSKDDFRSILHIKEVADVADSLIASAQPLVGRSFVAYTLRDVDNKQFRYKSATERATMLTNSQLTEAIAFRNGLHCAGKTCSKLVQWSEHVLLEFDAVTGSLKAWWIEQV
jgi:pimeloyl-ACP methyl ester carboxylesterase